ncbi:MAG: hypothetical protein ACK5JU_12460, partial [Bacteroidales bacterium]
MAKETPYEYHEGKLGIQGRFLFSDENADPNSLCLISARGFRKKIEREQIVKLREQGPNTPMLVTFDSLPIRWQEAVVTIWGEAEKVVRKTVFESLYERDMEAFRFYSLYKFEDQTSLSRDKVDEYTLNASVLNAIGKMY